MKSLSIGRDAGCDIVLNDGKDLISRRHAILHIYPAGKMTLVDQGQNGTYVNGIKITPNVPYPVSRKDKIMFAHVLQLDWKLVPDRFVQIRNVLLGGILIGLIAGGNMLFSEMKKMDMPAEKEIINQSAPRDTISAKETEKPQEAGSQEKKDMSVGKTDLPSKKAEERKEEEKKKRAEQEKIDEAKKDSIVPDKHKEVRKDTIIYM